MNQRVLNKEEESLNIVTIFEEQFDDLITN